MKKICIDARMIKSGGIGTYIRTILQNITNESYEIFLIVNSNDITRFSEYKNFNLIFLNANIYSIKEQILLSFKIPKCDLFFSPHYNIPIFPIRAKKRLVTIHDVYHLAFFSKLNFLEKLYAKFMINFATKISDKIITVSEFSKREILKYTKVSSKKIQVIHNAIDVNIFKKSKNIKDLVNVKIKLQLPEKYFLFVGNLKPHKNLINILKAFEIIQKNYEDYYLVIVGSNKNLINSVNVKNVLDSNNKLLEKIKLMENVSQQDLPMIYQLATALVFPSLYEGFGYPVIEAMSVDCPVITSNLASLPEICKDAAYYVDPYDIIKISDAMNEIIKNKTLKSKLIEKGQLRVKSFSIEDFVKKHILFIELIL